MENPIAADVHSGEAEQTQLVAEQLALKEKVKERQRLSVEQKKRNAEPTPSSPSVRPEMVQGAVEFLTSASVRKRRADAIVFLKEKKGLTEAEIEAAEKRADAILVMTPEQSPSSSSTPSSQPPSTTYAAPHPANVQAPYPYPPPALYAPPPPSKPPGILLPALAAAGITTLFYWAGKAVEKLFSDPKEEASEKKALSNVQNEVKGVEQKVDDVGKKVDDILALGLQHQVVQSSLRSISESQTSIQKDLGKLVQTQSLDDQSKRQFEKKISSLQDEVDQLKGLIQKVMRDSNAGHVTPPESSNPQNRANVGQSHRQQSEQAGNTELTKGPGISVSSPPQPSVASPSPSSSTQPSATGAHVPHSPQFLDIMQKLSQGEVPSDIKQIDDSPTDQNAIPLGAPASRQTSLKPWELRRKQKLQNQETQTTQTANTQPPSTQPATQPANTQPANTQPANTQPANTQPANTQPANTQPANTQPANPEPVNPEPVNPQPINTQPVNTELP